MDPSYVKVLNGKFICCRDNHNEPIVMVVVDENTPIQDKLLCLKCFETKRQVAKYISVQEAQTLIQEKLYTLTNQQEEQKKEILKDLNDFQNQMMDIRSRVISQIDEILRISQLWISDINNFVRKSDVNYFIEDFQLLQSDQQIYKDQIKRSIQSHLKKICLCIKKLTTIYKSSNCFKLLQNIQKAKKKLDYQINVQLIHTVKQQEFSFAVAFNNIGSTVVTGCRFDIKVWNFEKGEMIEKQKLTGHTNGIICLVFSKKHNWFASGSDDFTIRCWKEDDKKDWVSTQPGESHTGSVRCLILNNQEDQLISCSADKTIIVWKLNCQVNQLEYDYTLENGHTDVVYCISLNDSETALVSCGGDKRIILWSKEQNNRWIYKHELIIEQGGHRICFISENQIIYLTFKGIQFLLEYVQGGLVQRPNLNHKLPAKSCVDYDLFQTIKNKKRQVIIQKFQFYVYILKQQSNGQLEIVYEPIDCSDSRCVGNLTEDGEYLTIWNYGTKEYRVYNIQYQ